MKNVNETHDQNLKSWVESANDPDTDFPIQNLPWCKFTTRPDSASGDPVWYHYAVPGVAIGDKVLDLAACFEMGLFMGEAEQAIVHLCSRGATLHNLPLLPPNAVNAFRSALVGILSEDADSSTRDLASRALFPISDVIFHAPALIRDYTDFYCSIYHATNVGRLFRPDNPLLPNYKYIPIGYHGRASSIVMSGTDIKRPKGQNRSDQEKPPVFIPSKAFDYEMEVGFFVGRANELGATVPLAEAEEHIFGLCLMNDWSARDIQGWEYQPLGPFLSKSFATSISPFVVSMEALAPFRVPAFKRDEGDPEPLPHLYDEQNEKLGGIDIKLDVYIQSQKMREMDMEPFLLSRSNTKDLYWTLGQMLSHHASNGCNLQVGDLLATGTVSGPEDSERGCLLEITKRGAEPIELPSGETRKFLEDHDEIIMKGFCEREGFRRIGFGECRGMVLPAE